MDDTCKPFQRRHALRRERRCAWVCGTTVKCSKTQGGSSRGSRHGDKWSCPPPRPAPRLQVAEAYRTYLRECDDGAEELFLRLVAEELYRAADLPAQDLRVACSGAYPDLYKTVVGGGYNNEFSAFLARYPKVFQPSPSRRGRLRIKSMPPSVQQPDAPQPDAPAADAPAAPSAAPAPPQVAMRTGGDQREVERELLALLGTPPAAEDAQGDDPLFGAAGIGGRWQRPDRGGGEEDGAP